MYIYIIIMYQLIKVMYFDMVANSHYNQYHFQIVVGGLKVE